MDATSNATAGSTRRGTLSAFVLALLVASASLLAAPVRVHAHDARTASASLSVGATVVGGCTVGSRPFDTSSQSAAALDVTCRDDAAPLVETGPVVVLDTGVQVVVSTVNF